MKKLTILLIVLALACTSAFATISMTAGFGFGARATRTEQSFKYAFGPAVFFEADYAFKNGVTIYNNLDLTYKADGDYNDVYVNSWMTETLGAAYSFRSKDFSIIVGFGPQLQREYINKDVLYRLGIGTMCKVTYQYSEHFGASILLTPSLQNITFTDHPETFDDNFAASNNVAVGFTFTI